MGTRWLRALIGVVMFAGIGGLILMWVFARHQAAPAGVDLNAIAAGDLSKLVDPSKMVTVNWINDSGKPCKASIQWSAPNISGTIGADLSAEVGKVTAMITGPAAVDSASIERDGQKKTAQLVFKVPSNSVAVMPVVDQNGQKKLTLQGGTTYEFHVGKDDSVAVVPAPK